MCSKETQKACTLAVALGANLPSKEGPPASTLVAVRPLLEKIICNWASNLLNDQTSNKDHKDDFRWRWSPLFETVPIGGPPGQANYINAVLVVDGAGLEVIKPNEKAALDLLNNFLKVEESFGRVRKQSTVRWDARPLDLDLLAWGELHVQREKLILPHPRFYERSFVITPLAEALANDEENTVRRLPPRLDWPE